MARPSLTGRGDAMQFSQRYGFKPVKQIVQISEMDSDLKNGLWNVLSLLYWNELDKTTWTYNMPPSHKGLLTRLWFSFFKEPLDSLDNHWPTTRTALSRWYSKAKWDACYDFVEFIVQNGPQEWQTDATTLCNSVLEREISGYRFVGLEIAPITDAGEIGTIETAMSGATRCKGARVHVRNALEKVSDRKSPDFRNSIKESISAVEAIAQSITGDKSATLGKALDAIEQKTRIKLHGALKSGYDKIYGYASDAHGIRHAMLEESSLDFEDAYYMLVSCSAFVNYLVAKAQKAGIALR